MISLLRRTVKARSRSGVLLLFRRETEITRNAAVIAEADMEITAVVTTRADMEITAVVIIRIIVRIIRITMTAVLKMRSRLWRMM